MKKLLFMLALLLPLVAMADEWGEMELNKTYSVKAWDNSWGYYTPTVDGVLTITSSTYYSVYLASDTNGTKRINGTTKQYNPNTVDYAVTAGVTYYVFTPVLCSDDFDFVLTMEGGLSLELWSVSPAVGSSFTIGGSAQLSFTFSQNATLTKAFLKVGEKEQTLKAIVSANCIFFEMSTVLFNLMQEGTLKEGDEFTVTLTGVRMSENPKVVYGTDGTLSASFKAGRMPIYLISSENTSGDFLSYYTTNDERGIVRLHFSGPVANNKAKAMLKYGNVDNDADGEYYVEYLPVTVEGNDILVNLQGKRRKNSDMVSTSTKFSNIDLGILGVFDTYGDYAYTSAQGSMGSYWYRYDYKEVTANIVCEFTPASGSDLGNRTSIEVWIQEEGKLSYDGVSFDYLLDGERRNSVVPASEIVKTADPDDASSSILTIPLPAGLKDATDIDVSFLNLMAADGGDYNSVLRARYNALVISRTTPIAGSSIEWINENQELRVYINKESEVEYLQLTLFDLNAVEGDDEVLFSAEAHHAESGRGFVFTTARKYRLERGHDYRLEVTAFAPPEEGNPWRKIVGTDYVIYHGAADPFRYSDVLLSSITPDAGEVVLNHTEDATFTLEFDGLVLLDHSTCYALGSDGEKIALTSIEAIRPDDEGYANEWIAYLDSSRVAQAGHTLTLCLVPIDIDGNRVEGNFDKKDYSELRFTYTTDLPDGIAPVSIGSREGDAIYNLAGQRISAETKGVQILKGRKTIK